MNWLIQIKRTWMQMLHCLHSVWSCCRDVLSQMLHCMHSVWSCHRDCSLSYALHAFCLVVLQRLLSLECCTAHILSGRAAETVLSHTHCMHSVWSCCRDCSLSNVALHAFCLVVPQRLFSLKCYTACILSGHAA